MASVVGQASAAATSVAIPAHQAGDLIIVSARGTAAAPTKPAAAGTVPAWDTLQTGLANAVGLHVAAFVATAATTTTGTWTNATHIAVLVLRPAVGKTLSTSAARSSVGNGNNVQQIVYPALTLSKTDGSSTGVRVGTRIAPVSSVGNAPTGWTMQTAQPVAPSTVMAVHTRLALTANPAADPITTSGTNSAYRAVTVEVLEITPAQNVAATGVPSAQAFGTTAAVIPQTRQVSGVPPPSFDLHLANEYLAGQARVGWTGGNQFGAPTVILGGGTPAQNVPVNGVASAQQFGTSLPKPTFRVTVTGVGSAQLFGAVTTAKGAVSRTVTGVSSAQSFGAPTVTAGAIPPQTRPVSGVGSAQAFGAVTRRTTVTKLVGGVSSAQAFLAPVVVPKTTVPVSGKTSAQSFGLVTVKTLRKVTVAGVPSAQAFGAISVGGVSAVAVPGVPSSKAFGTVSFRTAVTKLVGGVSSAQAFTAPITVPRTTVPVSGLASAQSFGVPWFGAALPPQTVTVGGVPSTRAFGLVLATVPPAQLAEPDGLGSAQTFGILLFTVIGLPQTVELDGIASAQAFGKPSFEPPLLRPSECLLVDLDPAQSVEAELEPSVCAHDDEPLICGTFLCGEQRLPLLYLVTSSGQTLELHPASSSTLALATTPADTLELAAAEPDQVSLVEALAAEVTLVTTACADQDLPLICGTFLCGEERLPLLFLSPSSAQTILRLEMAETTTFHLAPAEEI